MFFNASYIFLGEQNMKQFFIWEEVKLGKGVSLDSKEIFNCFFELFEQVNVFTESR